MMLMKKLPITTALAPFADASKAEVIATSTLPIFIY